MPRLGENIIPKMELSCQIPDFGWFLGRKNQGKLQPFNECERASITVHYTGHCLHCDSYTHLNIGQSISPSYSFQHSGKEFIFCLVYLLYSLEIKKRLSETSKCVLWIYSVCRDPAKRYNPFLTHFHFEISIEKTFFSNTSVKYQVMFYNV